MSTPFPLLQSKASPAVPVIIQEVRRDIAPAPVILTDEQLTAATLAAASSIRARLNAIGTHTPSWFAEECAAVIAAEIRKAEASASRHANPFTVVTPAPGTPALTTNAA
jgi:hypothetical protein